MEKGVFELLKKLSGKKTLMHPNINTQILSMQINSLIKVVDYNKNKYKIV